MLTDRLPRVRFAHLPTPLEEMPRLSKALGGPRLLVKRDDQTGLASGGNKTRKLEFSAGEALARGADTLITVGAAQSNHCRQTAAAAARLGLNCVVVLRGHLPAEWNGNLLLDSLLGAEVRFSGDQPREALADEIAGQLQAAGRKPFLIPLGASDEIGAAGYAAAMEELDVQLRQQRIDKARIIFASSSFGTQAGMVVGAKALQMPVQVSAVAIDSHKRELQEGVAGLANRLAARMDLPLSFYPAEICAYDGYLGAGYGIMGEPEKEAISMAARYEGLLLDPVYSGRAMAGLIDLVRKGEFDRDETIIFWHTGGYAALFAYAGQLA